ncbi:SusC/RagA family TonB-linked outer membrane protein [Pararcticibacter amylolyticus]|uniref:SusC/RagA family TonB-linked outer membrane protein n=1 Tax=Pararcticibacter amylolyticus TaxID=2173175 RepID=A0A2U2PA06_9SPHI|nr:SusC/RagA family TonB-linked outer membrane protein [Pararcticibacter amylolyticus]PWG78200.1 SusC/RagA family TonB-linked outer membrane protein [Pararcticibacter amylolyticus]
MLKIRVQGILLPFFKHKTKQLKHPAETPAPIQQPASEKLPGQYLLCFYILMIILFSLMAIVSTYAQTGHSIKGKVTDEKGGPLPGALIKIKGTTHATSAGKEGLFSLQNVPPDAILVVSFIGYQSKELRLQAARADITISLIPDAMQLEEVAVVSTGYQQLPKERATGSFTPIDNTLINRSVSTSILDRLDGVSSGLIFTKSSNIASGLQQGRIEIRGRSTLFSNAEPLIVVDNFPYDGDPDNLNPNDIESITILKDAAAASVWGSRSGNGVIVISTKKGRLNTGPTIGFNASVNIGTKPDLYYRPQLSSAEWIEVEQFLYNKGAYSSKIADGYSALSPAVEIFQARAEGLLSAADSLSRINALKSYDVREQQLKYYYRQSVNQQYQANISGGSASQNYFVSFGYDKNLTGEVASGYDRFTLNASNTYHLLGDKLELGAGIIYTGSENTSGPSAVSLPYPYTRIADAEGNALAVARNLRSAYTDTAGRGKLLNWEYKPLDELNNKYSRQVSKLTDYRLNLSLTYKITGGLRATGYYSYEKGQRDGSQLHEQESYYARNLVNTFTQINPATGTLRYPLPMGAILYTDVSTLSSDNGRFQLSFDHQWGLHSVSALAGAEVRDYSVITGNNVYYGYNQDTRTNQNVAVNTTTDFPYFYGTGTGRIVINPTQLGTTDRFISYYMNGAYTYRDRYTASFSARRDESNIFGVATNQKGVPLWSAGLAWTINQEDFYHQEWLPQLKLRATFGYTGNVNNSISAYLTAIAGGTQVYNAYNATIQNPPNPSLRWEKNRNLNAGIDFASKGNRLSGSIDWWHKKGMDLIGNSPIAPQTGISLYTGNSATTASKGLDVQLNSINLDGKLKWYTTLLFNYSQSKVVSYKAASGTNYDVVSGNYTNPLEGYSYYAVFSFRYAGLTGGGDPQAWLNGNLSTDYAAIRNSKDRNDLVYNGSGVPVTFGSLRNTFQLKGFDLSCNILYKLGYFYRRNSLDNDALYGGGAVYQMDGYEDRWQKPGDEQRTNVPALVYPGTVARTSIYQFSDVLVDKGDHIRLGDIRLGYRFPDRKGFPLRHLNVFAYARNLGIIWRANRHGIDPDYVTGIPQPRTLAFGFKADL